jgi:uncharacterized cupredoxin-like copper-binding protein
MGSESAFTGRKIVGAASVAAALSVLLAGCGSSAKSSKSVTPAPKGTTSSAAAKATTAVAPAPKFTRVVVTATDSKLEFSVSKYTAGNYTFSLKNAGHEKHALEINGPGLKNQTGATVLPGQTTDLVVPLKKGAYELWSPVGNQKALGLDVHITVG